MDEYMHTQNIRKSNPLIYLFKKYGQVEFSQVGILEWVAMPSSRGSSPSREDCLSCVQL